MRMGLGGLGEKGRGLRSTSWHLQNIHRNVEYSIEIIVNDIAKSIYGARWVLKISRETHCKLSNMK